MGELAEKYVALLNEKLNNDTQRYAVYDYCKDFEKFWAGVLSEEGAASKAGTSEQKSLIIVWDSLPKDDGPAKLGPHLTPLDWALAFSTRVLKNNGVEDNNAFSIHIVDLTSTQFENAFAMQMASSICEAMPWVQIYTPLPRGRRAYEAEIPIDDLNKGAWPVAKVYLPTKTGVKSMGSKVMDRLEKLNQAWRAWVVQSNDHHDLNNMIGPLVIAATLATKEKSQESERDEDKHSLIGTMLTRLVWSNLLNPNGEDVKRIMCDKPTFTQETEIVLIDDQLSRGWYTVLGKLLGNSFKPRDSNKLICTDNDKIDLFGIDNPNFFLGEEYLGINKDVLSNCNILYETRQKAFPKPTIIVLDLYLFSGKPLDEKQKWYMTLAAAAEKINTLNGEKLAWPGFAEKVQLEEIASKGSDDEVYLDTALSLLPRLCALRWPSVPIIVFSATRRRGLVTKLADYGNIFLSTQKPNVLAGNAVEQVYSFVDNWQRDLHTAQGLLRVQKEMLDLQLTKVDIATEEAETQHTHVVIAFDEIGNFTSDKRSAVGGVMLFTRGKDEGEAIDLSVAAQESLRSAGVNFFDRVPFYPDPDKKKTGAEVILNIKPKKSEIVTELAKGLKECPNASLSAFCLWIADCSGSNEYQDGVYLNGLATCIELFACELLPCIKGKKSISWWLPTKMAAHWDDSNVKKKCSAEFARVMRETGDNKKAGLAFKKVEDDAKKLEMPKAILDAKKAASRFDVRYDNEDRTETIGGTGHSYSVVVQALSSRKCADSILQSTKNFRSRKIPYSFSPNNHWQCPNPKCDSPPVTRPHNDYKPKCSECKTRLIAEYSVLGHLADAVLPSKAVRDASTKFPSDEVGTESLNPNFSFEVEDGPKIRDFIHVSRLFDEGRPVEAFKLAFNQSQPFFRTGIMKSDIFAKARLELRVRDELRKQAFSISGNDIIELAGLSLRYIQPKHGSTKKARQPASSSQSPKKDKADSDKQKSPIKPTQNIISEKEQSQTSLPVKTDDTAAQANQNPTDLPQQQQDVQESSARYQVFITNFDDKTACAKIIKASMSALLGSSVEISEGFNKKIPSKTRLEFVIDSNLKDSVRLTLENAFKENKQSCQINFNLIKS